MTDKIDEITEEEARKSFVFPHQTMTNFKQENNGYVSFRVGDNIKNDFWYVLRNREGGKTSSQYHGLF